MPVKAPLADSGNPIVINTVKLLSSKLRKIQSQIQSHQNITPQLLLLTFVRIEQWPFLTQ